MIIIIIISETAVRRSPRHSAKLAAPAADSNAEVRKRSVKIQD